MANDEREQPSDGQAAVSSLFLTDAEVAEICAPLTQHAAQARYLRNVLKLPVRLRPNGKPLVLRGDVEALQAQQTMNGNLPHELPDVAALMKRISKQAA